MRDAVLEAIRLMIAAITGQPVVIGTLPPLGGYAVSFEGGAPLGVFWTLDSHDELPIIFNGKSADQQELAHKMDLAHVKLSTEQHLPYSNTWQVYAIETGAAPRLIDVQDNGLWIYGSSLRVKFYRKGTQINA